MKKALILVIMICVVAVYMLRAVTTISPDQPSMDYLEPEAVALGVDRTWVLALKDDPIIKKAEEANALASPEQGYVLWLNAANESAQLNKINETRYCLYKRRAFMPQWSTLPFVWGFFIDLGERIERSKSVTLPPNPLSIAITNNAVDFVEGIMPKEVIVVSQLAPDAQRAICHALMGLVGQAITMNRVPIVSTLIDRMKKYGLWDHPIVLQLKPLLMRSASNNKEMVQVLINAGFIQP
jgi:hypothetical protein